MTRWIVRIAALLITLLGLVRGAESDWESTGILVLDISRSMQDNDPNNIRSDGEQTFIDLLSAVDGNQLGIVFFGAKARVMKPITAIQRETIKSLKQSLPPIDSRAQRTEVGLGVAKGMEILEGRGGTRYLVLMSDGDLDRSGLAAKRWTRDDELALRELRALYPKLRQQNIPVFTIALTEQSHRALAGGAEPQSGEPIQMTSGEVLLKEIAESTNGKFYRILRQRDYLDTFLDIFLHVRPPTLYTLPRQPDAKFYLSHFDSEAMIIGPHDMVLVTPGGQRSGLGLPSPAASSWVRVFPYQHWSLAIVSRPAGELAGYEGVYQVVDQRGNPAPDSKVLVHSAIALAWDLQPKDAYAQHEVVQVRVKVHSFGPRSLQEDKQLTEFLRGAEIVASFWTPNAPLPVSKQLTPEEDDGRFVFAGTFEETATEGPYRLETELLSEQHPSLNRKLGTTFKVGPPYFHFAILRHGTGGPTRVLDSGDGSAQEAVFAGDRVAFVAELAGGTIVDFRREPTVRGEVSRDGQPWQVFPLERVKEGETVRYRSKPLSLTSAGAYMVTFRAEGSVIGEVWDDRVISTRSMRTNPVQIVFPGRLTVQPAPWTPRRIFTYVSLGGLALAVAIGASMAGLAHFARTPFHGWLLSTGRGAPQLIVLNGNPKGGWWRQIFPRRRIAVGTGPRCDYQLDPQETGAEIKAELCVGPWWDRSGALYLRSINIPSHVYVNGVEVAGKQRIVLKDAQALEKPARVRFGNYEMTFDA